MTNQEFEVLQRLLTKTNPADNPNQPAANDQTTLHFRFTELQSALLHEGYEIHLRKNNRTVTPEYTARLYHPVPRQDHCVGISNTTTAALFNATVQAIKEGWIK